tara:strand:+ start:125 stop:373 length:249 start_codon:yes stop_codon:yes gene_type:complete
MLIPSYIKNYLIIILVVSLASCSNSGDSKIEKMATVHNNIEEFATQEPIKPIEKWGDLNDGMVDLGKKLFHDVRLSGNNTIS